MAEDTLAKIDATRRAGEDDWRSLAFDPVVYFVLDYMSAAVKIGMTRDVRTRLETLQTGNVNPLVLLGLVYGGRDEEFFLHHRFRPHQTRGEWFAYPPIALDIAGLLFDSWDYFGRRRGCDHRRTLAVRIPDHLGWYVRCPYCGAVLDSAETWADKMARLAPSRPVGFS